MASKLSPYQRTRLAEAEAEIECKFRIVEPHARRIGELFARIRDEKLYLDAAPSFKEYCVRRWDRTIRRVYQLIAHSITVDEIEDQSGRQTCNLLHESGQDGEAVLPERDAQTVPLAGMTPHQKFLAWEQAVVSSGGEQPTAKTVSAAAATVRAKPAVPDQVLPAPLVPIFDQAKLWGKAAKQLRQAGSSFGEVERSDLWKRVNPDHKRSRHGIMLACADAVEEMMPRQPCPDGCQGDASPDNDPCPKCHGRGFLTKGQLP